MLIRFLYFILFFNILTVSVSLAAVIDLASCSSEAVSAAITSAATGDTIVVPSGTCTWTTSITIPNNKKLTIMTNGSTTITRDSIGIAFALGRSGSRITGFTITNGAMTADGYDFRIDHCNMSFSSWTDGISVMSRNIIPAVIATGLIDNNVFSNMRVLVNGTNYMLTENDNQNGLWASPLNLGSAEAVYIENNTFTGGINAIDGNYGGRYVFRYNTIYSGTAIEAHSVQGFNRAMRKWEIYGNIIDNQNTSVYYPFRLRGGTGVVLYNIVNGNWTNYGIGLDNVRDYSPAGDGLCDGDSTWDGNQDASGYPCRDQIGRSNDSPQWNHSPATAYTQSLVPAYALANKTESNSEVPFEVISWSQDHIKADRDFYNYTTPFDGASGVGCGTLSNLPATCTAGVAYWATNQSCSDLSGMVGSNPSTPISGTLYKCTSTNTWEPHYTPYTYPHPLHAQYKNHGSPKSMMSRPPS